MPDGNGYYVRPTLVINPDDALALTRQEVFLATYDNFGDGWKKFGLTFAKDLAETGHYGGE